MDKRNEVAEKAGELYNGSYHCCEAVVLAVSEHYGLENDLLLKMCSPFGGGMTSNGCTCGSLIAAYLCMGIFRGRASEKEGRNAACEPADRLFRRFLQRFGSVSCRDITGYDKKDPAAVALKGKKVKAEVCVPLTKEITRWILEELDRADENR